MKLKTDFFSVFWSVRLARCLCPPPGRLFARSARCRIGLDGELANPVTCKSRALTIFVRQQIFDNFACQIS